MIAENNDLNVYNNHLINIYVNPNVLNSCELVPEVKVNNVRSIPGSCDKLRSYWAGPYKIVRLMAPALAEVIAVNEQGKPRIVSLYILKEFRGENNVHGLPNNPPHPSFQGGDEITEIRSSECVDNFSTDKCCSLWSHSYVRSSDYKNYPKLGSAQKP